MKKAKLALWVILFGFLALLGYQNWDFFMSTHHLRINLYVIDEYSTPEIQNIILFLICFFAGLLIAYFCTLLERFKSKRTIKTLSTTLTTNQKLLDELKQEIRSLKGESPPTADPDVAATPQKTKDSDVS